MTTPTGSIKFSDITAEFGSPSGNNLGAFRINQSIGGRNWPLDDGVPISGSISFSQLRGKTINVVINDTGFSTKNVTSSNNYAQGVVVGGLKSLPSNTSGSDSKKIRYLVKSTMGANSTTQSISPTSVCYAFILNSGFLITNCIRNVSPVSDETTGTGTRNTTVSANGGSGTGLTINVEQIRQNFTTWQKVTYNFSIANSGSGYSNENVTVTAFGRTHTLAITVIGSGTSFKTGSWTPNTQLFYYITSSGLIVGYGGDGGEGAGTNGRWDTNTNTGVCGLDRGKDGGSAFGVTYPCTIIVENGGRIAGGGGGGGGGGFTYSGGSGDGRFMGGGGGGGAGLPSGGGGPRGTKCVDGGRNNNYGLDGDPGTTLLGGDGGRGSSWGDSGTTRRGGNGGNAGLNGEQGRPLSGSGPTGDGGSTRPGAPGGNAGPAVIRTSSSINVNITINTGGIVNGSTTAVGGV